VDPCQVGIELALVQAEVEREADPALREGSETVAMAEMGDDLWGDGAGAPGAPAAAPGEDDRARSCREAEHHQRRERYVQASHN
jgi:hypothetical protein